MGAAVQKGMLYGGLPFLTFGAGPTLVVLNGISPVNANPTGLARRAAVLSLRPLSRRFKIVLVSRRPGLTEGTTMADLASEHAVALRDHFGTAVNVLGMSTGGSIALQLAADHPGVVNRLVVAGAAHRLSPDAREVLRRTADLSAANDMRAAYHEFAKGTSASRLGQWLLGELQRRLEPVVFGRIPDRSDWVNTLRAEERLDLSERLAEIKVPVLVIGGGRDRAYSVELFTATADGIPDATLRLYPKRGHGGTFTDRRFVSDIVGFLAA